MVRARRPTTLGRRTPQPQPARVLLATLPPVRPKRTAVLLHPKKERAQDDILDDRRDQTRTNRHDPALRVPQERTRRKREIRIRLATPSATSEPPPPAQRTLSQNHANIH